MRFLSAMSRARASRDLNFFPSFCQSALKSKSWQTSIPFKYHEFVHSKIGHSISSVDFENVYNQLGLQSADLENVNNTKNVSNHIMFWFCLSEFWFVCQNFDLFANILNYLYLRYYTLHWKGVIIVQGRAFQIPIYRL